MPDPFPPSQEDTSLQQTTTGDRNQTIGQVLAGGTVVYVSGGQVIFNPTSTTAQAKQDTSTKIGPNPYKGLLAFHETDSGYYFGRSREVQILWDKWRTLGEQSEVIRLLPIYGASGSGKSSLMRAGLIPELDKHPLPGRDRARVAILKPGTDPVQALAAILARIAENDLTPVKKTREFAEELRLATSEGKYDGLHRIASLLPDIATFPLVVAVDQFEEVYSLCKDSQTRNTFIANLLHAAGDRARYVSVMLTMRSDFLGENQKYPELDHVFSKQGFLVPAMDNAELEEAIAKPAELAGHPLDAATVDLLLKDTEGREGALPLLQFALDRIWEGLRQGVEPAVTLEQIGGVGGALAGEAQRIYDSLSSDEQAIARRLFLGLVQLGEGSKDTRRRALFDSLVSYQDQPEQVKRVIGLFASPGVRLITLSANGNTETAEVTHEALFGHWQQLQSWLEGSRTDIRFQRRLDEAARHWDAQGQPEGLLWRPPDLDVLRSFYQRTGEELTPLQLSFFQTSEDFEIRREREKKQQRRRVVFMLSTGLVLLSGFSVAMAGLARFALNKADESELREQAAIVLNWLPTAKATEGLILAIDAVDRSQELAPNVFNTARSSLLSAVEQAREETLYQHEDAVYSVAFGPDDETIVSSSGDGTIRLWTLQGSPIGQPFRANQERVRSIEVSRDGRYIVSGSDDGTVRLWNLQGRPIGSPLKGQQGDVRSVALSPNGQQIVSAGNDGKVYLWNLQGQLIKQPFQAHTGKVYSVAFSPNGQTIASAGEDGTFRLWDLQGRSIGQPFRGHQNRVLSIAFNQDGTRIVSGGEDGTIRLWDLQGREIVQPLQGHEDYVWFVTFSPDGTTIASAGQDGTIRLWDQSGNSIGSPLQGHGGPVYSVQFSTNGKRLISGGADGTLRLWDLQVNPLSQAFQGHTGAVLAIASSPDGKLIATGSQDKTIRLWDLQGNLIRQPFQGHQDSVWSVAFSPDGKYIASGGKDSEIRLWDLQGNSVGAPFQGHQKPVQAVNFSPDGQQIVSGSDDGTIRLWDLQGRPIGQPFQGHQSGILSVVFSPDGKRIVSGGDDWTIHFWDLEGHPIGQPIQQEDAVRAIAFSTDGEMLVSGSDDGTIRLWNAEGNLMEQPFRGHGSSVNAVAFSPDDQMIVSGGSDGTVRFWDLQGNPIGPALDKQEGEVFAVTFSPDGQYVLSGGRDNVVKRWYGSWQGWLHIGCRRISRHPFLRNAAPNIDAEIIQNVQEVCAGE
ncbi:WD40 repeat domain-containing protein [Leptolyngbya sp. AN02str]|uniref:WD40 repeat domain-containing protein n=1 Tax=Leptolyngbya sp. AN02str TaxID=3423363 RepID=UPI003D31A1C9